MAVTANDSKSREKVYTAVFQGPDAAIAEVTVTGSMPDTTKTMPIYDSKGNILGHVALYANADLS